NKEEFMKLIVQKVRMCNKNGDNFEQTIEQFSAETNRTTFSIT
ncbi:unnamed protein product, partial [Rotaria sordida]